MTKAYFVYDNELDDLLGGFDSIDKCSKCVADVYILDDIPNPERRFSVFEFAVTRDWRKVFVTFDKDKARFVPN